MYLEANGKHWYLDSGCSRHMTGQESHFKSLKIKEGGEEAFERDGKGKIIGIRDVGNTSSNSIENVLLIRGSKYNLLSISQLCDKGYKVIFEADHCTILDKTSNEIKFFGKKHKNIYLIDLKKILNHDLCFVANVNDLAGLWHRRLGHASYGVISKLARRDLVIGLPKSSYSNAQVCSACA